MKTRDYKPNYPGAYLHAYNRGVNKSLIFLDDQDYQNFLYRAKVLVGAVPPPKRTAKGGIRLTVLPKGALEVICYCLMPNHFHFFIQQHVEDGLSMFMQRLCTSYSIYFNKKYNRVGHVFQDIFKCKDVLNDLYLKQITGYIHYNPSKPFDWKYSSLPVYLGKLEDNFVNANNFLEMHELKKKNYKNFLLEQYDPDLLDDADLIFEED